MTFTTVETRSKERYADSEKLRIQACTFNKASIGERCPDCGGVLIRSGGCPFCPLCGWSACP